MSGFSHAQRAAKAFNQHGSFTARVVEHGMAIELRHVDSGEHLTTLWAPGEDGDEWAWPLPPNGYKHRFQPRETPVDELVRAVATSVLDERRKS